MHWYEWVALVVAVFFASTWAVGLALSPRNRTGGNIVTVIAWWVLIFSSWLAPFTSLHLLWAFPVALLLPAALLLTIGRL
jgi:hypothetical protein